MSEYGADWYDEVMVEQDSPAMLPLETSPWRVVYEEIARMIDPFEPVVDLGCGTGRLIKKLLLQGHFAPITGVDWSMAALSEAASYCVDEPSEDWTIDELDEHRRRFGLPLNVIWLNQDLADWQPDPDPPPTTVYVCSEVLEHLPNDLELVARIPTDRRLILTVPTYWSESHLRAFPSPFDVWCRYSNLVDIRRWVKVRIPTGRDVPDAIHVCETRRR